MTSEVLRRARVATPLGEWTLVASPRGLCFLALSAQAATAGLDDFVARHFDGARLLEDDGGLDPARERLERYAAGEAVTFDFELDLCGTPFQLDVWRALLEIPRGQTRTYAELARGLGRAGAARAVGGAAGANPLPVIVPCHRLLAADGLGGFSGGLERKRALLALEGLAPGATQLPLAY